MSNNNFQLPENIGNDAVMNQIDRSVETEKNVIMKEIDDMKKIKTNGIKIKTATEIINDIEQKYNAIKKKPINQNNPIDKYRKESFEALYKHLINVTKNAAENNNYANPDPEPIPNPIPQPFNNNIKIIKNNSINNDDYDNYDLKKCKFMEPDRPSFITKILGNITGLGKYYTFEIDAEPIVYKKEKEIDKSFNAQICTLLKTLKKRKAKIMLDTRKKVYNGINRRRYSKRDYNSLNDEYTIRKKNGYNIQIPGQNGYNIQMPPQNGYNIQIPGQNGYNIQIPDNFKNNFDYGNLIKMLVDIINTNPYPYQNDLNREQLNSLSHKIKTEYNKRFNKDIDKSYIKNTILPIFNNYHKRILYAYFKNSRKSSANYTRRNSKAQYNQFAISLTNEFEVYRKRYNNVLIKYKDADYGFLGWVASTRDSKSHFIEFMLKSTKKTIYDLYWGDFRVKDFIGYFPILEILFKVYLIDNNASQTDIINNANYVLKNINNSSLIIVYSGKVADGNGKYENNKKMIKDYLNNLILKNKNAVIPNSYYSSANNSL